MQKHLPQGISAKAGLDFVVLYPEASAQHRLRTLHELRSLRLLLFSAREHDYDSALRIEKPGERTRSIISRILDRKSGLDVTRSQARVNELFHAYE